LTHVADELGRGQCVQSSITVTARIGRPARNKPEQWSGSRPRSRPRRIVQDVMSVRLRAVSRLVLGPLIVAVLAGVVLARFGVFRAAVAAYLVFFVAHAAVRQWDRLQLRLARRRLRSFRHRR
jgi:hypothetical protein